jgi:flagellar protein FliJ
MNDGVIINDAGKHDVNSCVAWEGSDHENVRGHVAAIARGSGGAPARRKAISAFTKTGLGGNRKLTLSCHHPPVAALKVAPAGRLEPPPTVWELESMKSRNTLIRLKKFQVEEKRRKVAQIEAMIADFQRMGADLDREIVAEQERAGIHDPTHFAYPTYAKAAMTRRENLKLSAGELAVQLEEAKIALHECFDDLKKVEQLDERDQNRDRSAEDPRSDLDSLDALRARGAMA